MQDRFRALLVTKDRERQSARVTELTDSDLMDGDVTVAVEYSTVNYKDGLAVTGKAPIIRKFPLIPGVDLAGRVVRSQNPNFHEGDRVVLNGYGVGEMHHGGYAERARVKGDWLIPLREGIGKSGHHSEQRGCACHRRCGWCGFSCNHAARQAGLPRCRLLPSSRIGRRLSSGTGR